ncbi:class I SAM-dependent methyltransferase [Pelagibacterales bacterium]|nr:class I SAM-dependent methyltransferase [Pelagibacterales bacterium]
MDNDMKIEPYKTVKSCFLCGSSDLQEIFSVNAVCLTGYFPLKAEDDPIQTPVSLMRCRSCKNIQARELIDPNLMFRDYWYRSSTTATMRNHLEDIVNRFGSSDGTILDIGCNDGTLLSFAKQKGMEVWGVEPSVALNDAPPEIQKKTVNALFGDDECDSFFEKANVKFDLITAISMFYDVPEPLSFIEKLAELLTQEGAIVIEVNYAKSFFERQNIDMLGQEHLIYYFIQTFSNLVGSAGLNINDAYLTDMNGGNITFAISRSTNVTDRYKSLVKDEAAWMENFDFDGFGPNVARGFDKFKEKLISISKTHSVKVLGASTRGAMIIQMLGLNKNIIDSAVDLQKNKVGRRIPGTDIEIEFDADHRAPDYYLVMPYQFRDEIIVRYTNFMKNGGGLLFYRPVQEVITYDNSANEIKYSPIV